MSKTVHGTVTGKNRKLRLGLEAWVGCDKDSFYGDIFDMDL